MAAAPAKSFVPPKALPAHQLTHIFPNFEILQLIGAGGMGAVYKARQISLNRIVALKVFQRDPAVDPAVAERFAQEARVLASLSDPGIVGAYEYGAAARFTYLAMEYVPGSNLRGYLEQGAFEPRAALQIAQDICIALACAHNNDVVHRDIKPENILIHPPIDAPADWSELGIEDALAAGARIRLADFGLAKFQKPMESFWLTSDDQSVGTAVYMAPEQIERRTIIDARADLYAVGVLLYEMLTGELPVGNFPPPSEKARISRSLDRIVLRSLAKDSDRRFATAESLASAIDGILHPWERRLKVGAIAAAAAVTFGLLAAVVIRSLPVKETSSETPAVSAAAPSPGAAPTQETPVTPAPTQLTQNPTLPPLAPTGQTIPGESPPAAMLRQLRERRLAEAAGKPFSMPESEHATITSNDTSVRQSVTRASNPVTPPITTTPPPASSPVASADVSSTTPTDVSLVTTKDGGPPPPGFKTPGDIAADEPGMNFPIFNGRNIVGYSNPFARRNNNFGGMNNNFNNNNEPQVPTTDKRAVPGSTLDQSATIYIDGLPGDMGSFFSDRLKEESGAKYAHSIQRGERATVMLTPVDDIQQLAFTTHCGTVAKVDPVSHYIWIHVDKKILPPALKPAITDYFDSNYYTRAMEDMNSWDKQRRTMTLEHLKNAPFPLNDSGGVLRMRILTAVEKMLSDPEGSVRAQAVDAYMKWGPEDKTTRLVKMARDSDFFCRESVMKALGKIHDPKTLPAIIAELDVQSGFAIKDTIIAFGAIAEPGVLKILREGSDNGKRQAIDIIKSIGTYQSLAALDEIIDRNDFFLKRPAEEAESEIRIRARGVSKETSHMHHF